MDSEQPVEDEEFITDLLAFAIEMIYDVFSKRLLYGYVFGNIKLQYRWQYTEDIGNAVFVIWVKSVENYREKFSNDFPKFMGLENHNFTNYLHISVEDYLNGPEMNLMNEILTAAAFFMELCAYSSEVGQPLEVEDSIKQWLILFKVFFQQRFVQAGGWPTLQEECCELSKIYERNLVAKEVVKKKISLFESFAHLSNAYYKRALSIEVAGKYSRFYTIDEMTGKIIPLKRTLTPTAKVHEALDTSCLGSSVSVKKGGEHQEASAVKKGGEYQEASTVKKGGEHQKASAVKKGGEKKGTSDVKIGGEPKETSAVKKGGEESAPSRKEVSRRKTSAGEEGNQEQNPTDNEKRGKRMTKGKNKS